jgi:hypothetical protein
MKLNIVPARAGWDWVKQGVGAFLHQPLAMSGLFLLFMGVVSLLSVVPILGSVLALALLPAATLGLMAAARQAAEGRFPMPTVLATALAAGRERRTAMLKLGALYAVGFLGVIAATAVFDGGAFAQMYLDGTALTEELAQSDGFQMALWVGMGLNLPLAMLFWHAPALVHWHHVEPSKSLFFSAMACWKNKAAMLVFGACWVGVFMLGGLVVSLVAGILGGQAVVSLLTLPAVMVMASMFFTSIYFTFRDSFTDESPAATPPEL